MEIEAPRRPVPKRHRPLQTPGPGPGREASPSPVGYAWAPAREKPAQPA